MDKFETKYNYLIEGLNIDVSDHWSKWDWKKVYPVTSYKYAKLEEYRDSIIVAYRLYNLIGLAHIKRVLKTYSASKKSKILDVGGGTGRKAIPLALEGYSSITLTDISPNWLKLAKEKAEKMGVKDKIDFQEADILDMKDFESESFDFIFAMGGVGTYCGDLEKALKEMVRLLKKGGVLLFDGIHNYFMALRYATKSGNFDMFKKILDNKDSDQEISIKSLTPNMVREIGGRSKLNKFDILSEFIFELDDSIRVNSETKLWEKEIIDLELNYYNDKKFLGTSGLMLEGVK